MTVLFEPLDRALARSLRSAVLELRDRHGRRHFPAEISVGGLGRPQRTRASFTTLKGEAFDHDLRCEIVAALLQDARRSEDVPPAWLSRTGSLHWNDLDADWWPAFTAAYAEAGLDLTAVVMTKSGWYDPRSGLRREWRRLRRHSPAAAAEQPPPPA